MPVRGVLHAGSGLCSQPAHTAAKVSTHLLDLQVMVLVAILEEVRPAALVLGDPTLRECPVLDVGKDPAHGRTGALVDDLRTAHVVAVLGGVGDRVAHVPGWPL